MHTSDTVQRVRIYLSESDTLGGRPRYLAALDLLRESGATGATALRGVAGFGVGQRLQTTQNDGRGMPIVIEWVDRAERVARILTALDALLPEALITIEVVQVYRARLRSSGPFGEHSVGELTTRDVATTTQEQSLTQALHALLESGQTTLPVLDEGGCLVGSVGAAELRRYQLPAPQQLAARPAAKRAELLVQLEGISLAEAMTTAVLALSVDSSILQAAKAMVEWGIDELPVAASDGRFYGIFGIDRALQAAQEARAPSESSIRDADLPAPIGVLMQGLFRTVLGYALAAEGLEQLVAAGETPLVVVDNGQPLGLLDYDHILRESEPLRERLSLLPAASLANRTALQETLGETRVASLPLIPLPTLPISAPYDHAITVLREHNVPWIAAVDDQGKLQGLVGRRTLLRALVQASDV